MSRRDEAINHFKFIVGIDTRALLSSWWDNIRREWKFILPISLVLYFFAGIILGTIFVDGSTGFTKAPAIVRFIVASVGYELILVVAFFILLLSWQPCKWIRLRWRIAWNRVGPYPSSKESDEYPRINDGTQWDKDDN